MNAPEMRVRRYWSSISLALDDEGIKVLEFRGFHHKLKIWINVWCDHEISWNLRIEHFPPLNTSWESKKTPPSPTNTSFFKKIIDRKWKFNFPYFLASSLPCHLNSVAQEPFITWTGFAHLKSKNTAQINKRTQASYKYISSVKRYELKKNKIKNI